MQCVIIESSFYIGVGLVVNLGCILTRRRTSDKVICDEARALLFSVLWLMIQLAHKRLEAQCPKARIMIVDDTVKATYTVSQGREISRGQFFQISKTKTMFRFLDTNQRPHCGRLLVCDANASWRQNGSGRLSSYWRLPLGQQASPARLRAAFVT